MAYLRQPSFRKFRRAILLILLALFVAAGFGLWRFFFPLESSEQLSRADLWRKGAEEVSLGGLHAYRQDLCSGSPGCVCIGMVHGLGDQALTWRRLIKMDREEWGRPVRLYAFDLPGSGQSEPELLASRYRARKLGERLGAALVDEEECLSWTLVGNSLGGWVAAWTAIQQPQLIDALVLVGAVGLKRDSTTDAVSFFSDPSLESLKDFQKRAYHEPRSIPDWVLKKVVSRIGKSDARKILQAQTEADFLDGQLKELQAPVLVFRGGSDRIASRETSQAFYEWIPRATLLEQQECGHLPQKECPEKLKEAIVSLLNDASSRVHHSP